MPLQKDLREFIESLNCPPKKTRKRKHDSLWSEKTLSHSYKLVACRSRFICMTQPLPLVAARFRAGLAKPRPEEAVLIQEYRLAEFTGERVIPGKVDPDLLNEHVARYAFAARHGKGAAGAGCRLRSRLRRGEAGRRKRGRCWPLMFARGGGRCGRTVSGGQPAV